MFLKELEIFVSMLTNKIKKDNYNPDINVIQGKKYTKILIDGVGKYMLNNESGNLYCITGYGVPDLEKNLGFLPNIISKDFRCDGYTIVPKDFLGKSVGGYAGQIAQHKTKEESKILEDYIDTIRKSKMDTIINDNPRYKIPGDKLIVVDIQPVYDKGMEFTVEQFAKSLKRFNGDILYFYNGAQMGLDKLQNIKDWYKSTLNDYSSKFEDFLNNIRWIEKGFGFFRDILDGGYGEETIKYLFLYLSLNGKWNTNELTDNEIKSMYIDDIVKDKLLKKELVLSLPNFDVDILKKYDGATIVGGGKDQCLAEVKIIMDALKIKYNEFKPFIY